MVNLKLKKKKYGNLLLKFWFNSQNILNFLNSNKKKWKFLKFQKQTFKLNNIKRFILIKSLKNLYLERLKTKKKIKYFYGHLPEKKFKILFKKNNYNIINLIKFLECKIDILLFRSNLVVSLKQVKQLIHQKKILLNNKIITTSNIYIKPGDIIKILTPVQGNLIKKHNYVKYLEINQKTLQIILLKYPLFYEIPFLIKLNLYLSSEFYKK